MPLVEFAEKHDLTMYVEKRKQPNGRIGYTACFHKVFGPTGVGKSEPEAIADYAEQISCTNIVSQGITITVPLLT